MRGKWSCFSETPASVAEKVPKLFTGWGGWGGWGAWASGAGINCCVYPRSVAMCVCVCVCAGYHTDSAGLIKVFRTEAFQPHRHHHQPGF